MRLAKIEDNGQGMSGDSICTRKEDFIACFCKEGQEGDEERKKGRARQDPELEQEDWVLAEERSIEKPSGEVVVCVDQNGL